MAISAPSLRMWGRYEHSLDDKGRVIVPLKFRDKLGEEFVMTIGAGRHIRVYPMPIWDAMEEELVSQTVHDELDPNLVFLQRMFGNCEFSKVDKENRLSIPRHLRDWANVRESEQAIIIGNGTRLEIWSRANWETYSSEFTEDRAALASNNRRIDNISSPTPLVESRGTASHRSMDEPGARFHHVPVLLTECIQALAPKPGDMILDATLGGGGHSAALAEAIRPGGTLIGLDRDREAIAAAGTKLAPFADSVSIILIHASFGKLDVVLDSDPRTAGARLDGVLFDLGVSSHQLDASRGFSFRRDEPLDMRMDRDSGPTAAEYLQTVEERELVRVLLEFGEERWAHRIAANVVAQRKRGDRIETTRDLTALVEASIPRGAWPRDIHVATRTYQALRIALNDELVQLERGLEAAVQRLKPGGRVTAISFHSLEDRIVKRAFARWSGSEPSAPGSSPAAFLPRERIPILKLLTRKPILPSAEETARNPRARSSKLRAAERIAS